MFAEQEVVDEHEKIQQKAEVMRSAAELRDELFEGNQGVAIKMIGGTLVGLYFIYRWLLK